MSSPWKEISSVAKSRQSANDAKPKQTAKPNAREEEEENRGNLFTVETPERRLDDLIVADLVKEQLENSLNRIRYHDAIYHTFNMKSVDPRGRRNAINLYGLPGTGKSFAAEAIARHLGQSIISVNYADIESKYVGETPKNIVAVFKKAKETNSLIFFDEADSILGKRLTDVTQSSDHSVNVARSVMLLQLDKFDGIVVFASNLPRNYDRAFVRRILAHIEFGLPDAVCRRRLWSYLMPRELPRACDVTLDWLAGISDGLSGGDILNTVYLTASAIAPRQGRAQRARRRDIEKAVRQIRAGIDQVGVPNAKTDRVSTRVLAAEEATKHLVEEK